MPILPYAVNVEDFHISIAVVDMAVGATLIRLFSDNICLIVLGVGLHVFSYICKEEQLWSCLCCFSESRPT